jgi:hypothetical protein
VFVLVPVLSTANLWIRDSDLNGFCVILPFFDESVACGRLPRACDLILILSWQSQGFKYNSCLLSTHVLTVKYPCSYCGIGGLHWPRINF